MRNLLFLPMVGLFLYAFFQKKQFPLVALTTCLLAIIGTGLVVFPSATDVVAAQLDMERGMDLVFYLSIVVGVVAIFSIHLKLRKINLALTALARSIALDHRELEIQKPKSGSPSSEHAA